MNTLMKKRPEFFGSLMEDFLNESNWMNKPMKYSSMPAVNIKELDNEYQIEVAAPGLNKEDFNIEVHDNVLTLSASKNVESEDKNENYTRREFSFTSFQRNFTLPVNTIETGSVGASYIDGILKISLPKKEQKESIRKIEIK